MRAQSVKPRVLVVEEAGQVLEAHILASLVDSGQFLCCGSFRTVSNRYHLVQHIICIGDPKQLRPNLATYGDFFCWLVCLLVLTLFPTALSMDSSRGKDLFKFDRSLMERLADNGFPMSQINVQRRMRPTISHHIRYELLIRVRYNCSRFVTGRSYTLSSRITKS